MPNILLVNFDENFGPRLAAFLRVEGHQVREVRQIEDLSQVLRNRSEVPDLLIVDVSNCDQYIHELLDQFTSHRMRHGLKPMVLCMSRVYLGPRFALNIERKGARFLYV